MKKLVTILVVVAVVLIIFLLLGPLYIVEEGEQAVVTRFGQIVATETEAGLKFKTPVIDTVTKYPKRIQSWDGEPQRVPTAENQFIWVDTTARWVIKDPALFYASVTTLPAAYGRLDDILDSIVRTVISSNSLAEAVRSTNLIREVAPDAMIPEAEVGEMEELGDLEEFEELFRVRVEHESIRRGRRTLAEQMFGSADSAVGELGVELVDLVIRQIRYSDDLTESVYNRMISERNQIAQAYRSLGEGRKQEILGQMENEKAQILSAAYAEAQEIRGDADREAASIYNRSYSQDPAFFEFWQAINSYEETIPRFRKTLTTDMDYFRYLYSGEGR